MVVMVDMDFYGLLFFLYLDAACDVFMASYTVVSPSALFVFPVTGQHLLGVQQQ